MFLLVPFRKVIGKLAPHSGWALKKLKELPVRGFGLLAINEIFAFMIPPILVLIIRLSNNPIGWQSWSEVSNVGGIVLFASLLLWIFFDILRIMRVRRMMKAVEKHKVWGARALMARKLTPAGLVSSIALGAAVEVARVGAGKISDKVDNKLQEEFNKISKVNTKTLMVLLLRDLLMGLVPLLILAYVPAILP
jgi:heme/copper-type cytochrome/quinol oxidase subunit 1